ncbi:MAG TPA: hypothetical protein VNI20_06525 [Fimbriimonadaceae bacterium]|nr:hypothetical protein [Fimbriimonadaceae bacterium]
MRRFGLIALCLACVAALPLSASASDDAYFGPQVGVFLPSNKGLRNALGDSWFSFGAGRIRGYDLDKYKIAYDWQAVNQRKNGNNVFILTGSIGFVRAFGRDGDSTIPYAALRGGLAYLDYSIDTPSGHQAGKRASLNANAALGINFNHRINLEARYDMWNSFDGITFNGLTIALTVGLARF